MQDNFRNFSWILPGALAGAMGPTERRHLIYFELNDVTAIVRMEEQTISGEPWGFRGTLRAGAGFRSSVGGTD